ncbi:hypothetical protein CDAR_318751 [Caerostris darwini]|uniref:Uncharacterized protein n=1 Tax=Caerostris darwini TaxID=1538125 RepID=A0AAV4PRE7_9ARAC|nr:hypothetical protein CDAR_540461 [Caerostris darwini]GIY57513.1 hypothetical protein CDAR_318751 [Caerostris darwini]
MRQDHTGKFCVCIQERLPASVSLWKGLPHIERYLSHSERITTYLSGMWLQGGTSAYNSPHNKMRAKRKQLNSTSGLHTCGSKININKTSSSRITCTKIKTKQ